MKKSRVWHAIAPGTQTKPQDTLQIRKTPWHGVTKQPPAVPLPPNATPERNEKIKVLAGIPLLGHRAPLFQAQKSVHRAPKTLRAGMLAGNSTRHPSNQENTLARRRNSLLPSLCRGQTSLLNRMKNQGSGRQFFQAHKTSHKTPFKSGKHPGTA